MGVLDTAGADVTAAAEISDPPQQVLTTPAAVALMETLQAKYGPLMFHQSGGCCDGSSPMCYPLGEFMTGSWRRQSRVSRRSAKAIRTT